MPTQQGLRLDEKILATRVEMSQATPERMARSAGWNAVVGYSAMPFDRRAGSFRFAPENAGHPHDRRYVPGTLVAETTWHTPTGWLIAKDLLVMGPSSQRSRRPEYRGHPASRWRGSPLGPADRAVLAGLSRLLAKARRGRFFVEPETLLRWHSDLVRRRWTYASRPSGRPSMPTGTVKLALRLAKE